MIVVGDTLLSEDLFEAHFACDLAACAGACCVQGDVGAPLRPEERERLEALLPVVSTYLSPEGLAVIHRDGVCAPYDGRAVAPVRAGGACVYAVFDTAGVASCGLERAYRAGVTDWPKPISCHLYPVRELALPDATALNVETWQICDPARRCGAATRTTVLEFCRDALVRRFGEAWYTAARDRAP